MNAQALYCFLRRCLLAGLLAAPEGAAAQVEALPAYSFLPHLFAYKDGNVLTFSQDNRYWFKFQDRQGVLWGTDQYGKVIRYDGYEAAVFPVNPMDGEGVQCTGQVRFLEDCRRRHGYSTTPILKDMY